MRLPVLVVIAATMGRAQQPFLTDDADISPLRHFHLELLNEYDRLQKASYPTVRQNTTRAQLTFGVSKDLEIGFDVPQIAIDNAAQSGIPNAFGFGDLDLQTKYRIRTESGDSNWPALTLALYVEIPTGNPRTQLGSGVADWGFRGKPNRIPG